MKGEKNKTKQQQQQQKKTPQSKPSLREELN